jgi:two-component system, OmpR family, phosphate regulon sensor histidine kinase PhoR
LMRLIILALAEPGILNRLYNKLLENLSGISPLLLILFTFLATTLLLVAYCRSANRRYRRASDARLSQMVSQFVDERTKSEAILLDLDVGVVAYGRDGILINVNPAARKMLAPRPIPENFNAFIDEYGQENGIRAAMLLGSESLSGKIMVGDRIIRLRLKLSHFIENGPSSSLVVLTDITDQESEEKQRKEFVANVSHELKTPLTTIKTYSESLLDWGLAEKNEEAVRKDIWRIHDDSLRMERLVEDLLLLSSIDSKGIRVRMEILDFAYVIRQAVERMQHQAQGKELEMTCYALSRIPSVYVDRAAIERVVTNLVSNAIKYTEKGGKIKVYVSYLIDDAYVKVVDTGFGIDKDHLPRIFNRFYRVDMTGSRMYGGTGLGLSIAKELVELHDGKINVNSVLGKGTEFTVMIPIARKVFCDTLEGYQMNNPLTDPMHHAAAADLQLMAAELGLIQGQLSDLAAENIEKLLDRMLERDRPAEQVSFDQNQLDHGLPVSGVVMQDPMK